jgi:hypothetical protein
MKLLCHAFALLLLVVPSSMRAATCAPTPEDAALSALRSLDASPSVGEGYRMQDIQVDVLTHRLWVRVRRCGNASAPAVLVPMNANLDVRWPEPLPKTDVLNAGQHALSLRVGDAVRVILRTDSVRMEMEGKALQGAAIGDRVEVVLRHSSDEPEHRIFGTLRASGIVEVQP